MGVAAILDRDHFDILLFPHAKESSVLCFLRLVFLMLLRLVIAALWSSGGKGLASLPLLVMFIGFFVTFSCVFLGLVWYSIVSFLDLCRFSFFHIKFEFNWPSGFRGDV